MNGFMTISIKYAKRKKILVGLTCLVDIFLYVIWNVIYTLFFYDEEK